MKIGGGPYIQRVQPADMGRSTAMRYVAQEGGLQ